MYFPPHLREAMQSDPAAGQMLFALESSSPRKCARAVGDHRERLKLFWFALQGYYTAFDPIPSFGKNRFAFQERVKEGLRAWVDSWIDSGIQPGGVEDPYARSIQEDQRRTLQGYLGQSISPSIRFLGGCVVPAGFDRDYPERDDLRNQNRYIRRIARKRKREREEEGRRMRRQSALEGRWDMAQLWPPEDWQRLADEEAKRLFLVLLDSGGVRFHIARCAKCGRYDFALLAKMYKRGWHCGAGCRHRAANKASRNRVSEALQNVWRTRAVSALRRADRDMVDATWLRPKVNAALPPEQWVKKNWLTRHAEEIEAQAARRAGGSE